MAVGIWRFTLRGLQVATSVLDLLITILKWSLLQKTFLTEIQKDAGPPKVPQDLTLTFRLIFPGEI